MILEVVQREDDKTDYISLAILFIMQNGVKTKEQLEQRFQCLLTEFAIMYRGNFDAKTNTLKIIRE
jgi:hypothetical protein